MTELQTSNVEPGSGAFGGACLDRHVLDRNAHGRGDLTGTAGGLSADAVSLYFQQSSVRATNWEQAKKVQSPIAGGIAAGPLVKEVSPTW